MEENPEINKNVKKKHSWKIYIFAIAAALLFIITALAFSLFQWKQKADYASEKVIREYVGKMIRKDPNNLTDEDFKKIEILGFPLSAASPISIINRNRNLELSDISLIEKFTNLNYLQLSNIKYPESKIPKLIKILEKFGIKSYREKYVIDLTPLEKLNNLQTLFINKTPVNNIKPLSNLYNLKNLTIRETWVSDLEPLRKLSNLEKLNIENTNVTDLEPLSGLKNLKLLYIGGCKNISEKQIEDLKKALPELNIKTYIANR